MVFYYRPHGGKGPPRWRVWQAKWGGDTFEVLSQDDFDRLAGFAARLTFGLVEAPDFNDD